MSSGLPEEVPDVKLTKPNLDVKLKDYSMPEFKEYDFNNLPIGFTMIMYAIRRSGKTHLLAEIVHTIRDRFEEVFLFSNTAKFDQLGYNYIPRKNRYTGFDQPALSRIINDQETKVQLKMKNPKNPNVKIPRRLLIFDDVVNDSEIRHSDDFNFLFVLGRHLCGDPQQLSKSELGDFSIAVLSQSVGGRFGIPAVARRNVDCVVSFFGHAETDRELIATQYGSVINAKIGDAIVKHITKEKYVAAVFDISNVSARNYEDYVYRYKAKPKIPRFLIGKDTLEFKSPESSTSVLGYQKYVIDIPIGIEETRSYVHNIVS